MDSTAPPPPSWSGLRTDLLLNIANRLDCRLDRLRFRAVCYSWRSILAPPCRRFAPPSPPLRLPFPIAPNPHINPRRRGFFNLHESTVYCLQPLKKVSDTWKNSKCWFVKIEETDELGKVCFNDPLSRCNNDNLSQALKQAPSRGYSDNLSRLLPGGLNLLDYRVSEVAKAYGVKFVESGKKLDLDFNEFKSVIAKKVAVCFEGANFAVMAVHTAGKLSIWRMGDKKWTVINDGRERAYYEDVIYFNGKFYAVDCSGLTISVDLSLKISQVVPAMPYSRCGSTYKCLLISMGDLFRLDKNCHFDDDPFAGYLNSDSEDEDALSTTFNVYKLNEEKREWVQVTSLGDRVLFVGYDCSFSVSAKDFPGCKRNCIYYSEDFREDLRECDDDNFPGCNAALFDTEDCTARMLSAVYSYSGLFWPPPAWVMTSATSASRP